MAATTGESRYGDSAPGRVLRWFASTLRLMARNKVGFAGFLVVTTIVLISFVGPIFVPEDETVQVSQIYQSPSLSHPLGTDSEGKDVLSQIINGGWPILTIGYLAAAISTTLAVTREIAPNMAGYIAINFTLAITASMYAVVALTLLGLVPLSENNWGVMINLAWTRGAIFSKDSVFYIMAPIAAIALHQFGLVAMNRSLTEVFDPRLRKGS
jgi:ABC-type dipeptide/oligopeptide/nickel transport system permease subunit